MSEPAPAPDATGTRRRDPLWWVVAILPVVVLVRVVQAEGRLPAGIGEWLLVGLFALVTAALVAVVLFGVRRGWQLIRTGAGTDQDRATRRARSATVAETLVGTATLLLIVAVAVWLVVLAR